MPAPYNGQCLCGAVQLAMSSEPAAVLSCYCRHCQLGAGGPNQVIAKFSSADVEVKADSGAISTYTLTDTGSGNPKEKAFCQTCGCTLWTVPSAAAGKFFIVRTSLLTQGLELKPGNEIYTKNRPTWMSPAQDIPQWEEARK